MATSTRSKKVVGGASATPSDPSVPKAKSAPGKQKKKATMVEEPSREEILDDMPTWAKMLLNTVDEKIDALGEYVEGVDQ